MRLNAGTGLTLVYFQSGKESVYTGPARIWLGAKEPKMLSGNKGTTQELAILQETGIKPADDKGYAQAAIVLRGAGMRAKKIKIVGPKNSKVMTSHPLFRWQGPERGLQYRFVLMDESGRALIETLVDGADFQLPSEIRLVDNAWYTWRIEARLSSGKVYSATADFSLLDRTERDRLNRLRPAGNSPFAKRVLYATVLEQNGLLDEARRYWQTLAAERPDAAALKAKVKR